MAAAEGFSDLLIKPIAWQTSATVRKRPLMIECHAGYIVMWEKGRQARVSVDLGAVYDLGWKMQAREAKRK